VRTDDLAGAALRLADRLEADTDRVLADFRTALQEADEVAAGEPAAPARALDDARLIYGHVLSSLRSGAEPPDTRPWHLDSWVSELTQVSDATDPVASLRASSLFFRIVLARAAAHLDPGSAAPGLLARVAVALERGLTVRAEATAASLTERLLKQVHDALEEERRWISLELHDRVGNAIGTAHRQLELLSVYLNIDPVRAGQKLEAAQDKVREAMESLRGLTVDLYTVEPVVSLRASLVSYLAGPAAAEDVALVLRVTGDESAATPPVLREAFLVLREAGSNALCHASPMTLSIRVEFTATDLMAVIEDDGCGFDPESQPRSTGLGISAMRERARRLGGTLGIRSAIGQGTVVRLTVPLTSGADR
jgi:signal transduction histidine kinase